MLKYRLFGRQRFFTIRPHESPWTLEKARREAKRLLGLVAGGRTRQTTKRRHHPPNGRYTPQDHRLVPRRCQKKQRPRTYSEIERYLLVAWKPLHYEGMIWDGRARYEACRSLGVRPWLVPLRRQEPFALLHFGE